MPVIGLCHVLLSPMCARVKTLYNLEKHGVDRGKAEAVEVLEKKKCKESG